MMMSQSAQNLETTPAKNKKYTPLFRSMTETACHKKLKRNELLVLLFLLEKTLGFGKPKDQLTTGTIAYHTGIRKDRAKQAIQGVLASGLFDRTTSPRFEYEYTIGEKFLDRHKGHFFAPALPKNRDNFLKTESFSENRAHTDTYLFNSLPSQLQPTGVHHSAVINLGLDAGIQIAGGSGTNININPNPDVALQSELESIPPSQPEPAVCDWSKASLIEFPDSIPMANRASILKIFQQGTLEAARNAILVFKSIEASGEIRKSATGLLISLADKARKGILTLPDAPPSAAKTQYFDLETYYTETGSASATHAVQETDDETAPEAVKPQYFDIGAYYDDTDE